jgi:hypothetical protein
MTNTPATLRVDRSLRFFSPHPMMVFSVEEHVRGPAVAARQRRPTDRFSEGRPRCRLHEVRRAGMVRHDEVDIDWAAVLVTDVVAGQPVP